MFQGWAGLIGWKIWKDTKIPCIGSTRTLWSPGPSGTIRQIRPTLNKNRPLGIIQNVLGMTNWTTAVKGRTSLPVMKHVLQKSIQ